MEIKICLNDFIPLLSVCQKAGFFSTWAGQLALRQRVLKPTFTYKPTTVSIYKYYIGATRFPDQSVIQIMDMCLVLKWFCIQDMAVLF